MSHLLKFRNGWQSEHLARFILSKFSFIAEPNNISDDLGSDFFCTLFSVSKDKFLLPQNSIAIQIKSNKRIINISNKLDYLFNIEIPFFVGVVNRAKKKITFYSGESIPHFFSKYGNPSNFHDNIKVTIKLLEEHNNNFYFSENENHTLYFPKVIEIGAEFDHKNEPDLFESFKNTISIIQKNISAKKSTEYLFDSVNENGITVYAGSGSMTTYQENLCKRLCEALYNIEYHYNSTGVKKVKEFKIYETTLHKMKELNLTVPHYVNQIYHDIKNRIDI